jgi:hypothetical protein
MLDLQPLVTRLVEDILRAIRAASLDELRGPAKGAAKPRRRAPTPRRPPKRPVAVAPERPSLTDITDPEALLGLAAWAAAEAPAPPAAPCEIALLRGESLHPNERPAAAARAHLRAGETLAREAGTGVVIRRAKRV